MCEAWVRLTKFFFFKENHSERRFALVVFFNSWRGFDIGECLCFLFPEEVFCRITSFLFLLLHLPPIPHLPSPTLLAVFHHNMPPSFPQDPSDPLS